MSAVRRIPDVPSDDVQDIARALLLAIGENPDREGLADTARRVAGVFEVSNQGLRT